MNSLEQAISKKSTKALVQILEYEQEKYSLDALTVVRQELQSRHISIDEYDALKVVLNVENVQQEKRTKEIEELRIGAKKATSQLIETVHPMTPKDNQTILRILAFIFGVFCVLAFKENVSYLYGFVKYDIDVDLWLITSLLSILFGFFVIFKFWKFRKIGWLFVVAYLGSSVAFNGYAGYQYWQWDKESKVIESTPIIVDGTEFEIQYSTEGYNQDLLAPSFFEQAMSSLLVLVVCSLTLWFLAKVEVRQLYGVSKLELYLSIVLGLCHTIGVLVLI